MGYNGGRYLCQKDVVIEVCDQVCFRTFQWTIHGTYVLNFKLRNGKRIQAMLLIETLWVATNLWLASQISCLPAEWPSGVSDCKTRIWFVLFLPIVKPRPSVEIVTITVEMKAPMKGYYKLRQERGWLASGKEKVRACREGWQEINVGVLMAHWAVLLTGLRLNEY